MNRCSRCGHFLKRDYPFEACPACRNSAASRVLGVDEHGFKVGAAKYVEVLRSQTSNLDLLAAADREEQRLADFERSSEVTDSHSETSQTLTMDPKIQNPRPVKRRWWRRR